jgi:hypothetical protein
MAPKEYILRGQVGGEEGNGMSIRRTRAAVVAALVVSTLVTMTPAPAGASSGNGGGGHSGCHAGAPGVGDPTIRSTATAATTSGTTC